ncbi:MAG: malonyl-CoA decarboxylase [Betaproteobacteria bacterium]|nr:malonyl-CoA decarboxylase family protein [Betaproteobacteria bacterium]MDE2047608.1 malonyl-CoA decarboxylase [Betaproteobacteria bacterium]
MLEALRHASSKRDLQLLLGACRRLLSVRGETNASSMAQEVLARFNALPAERHADFFRGLATNFNPEPADVLKAAQAYAQQPGAAQLIALVRGAEPPRQELFRRLNRAPQGTATIVRMRHSLLKQLDRYPELAAVEADLLHLLSSWFNPGFLEMQRVDWNSPAQLLEQLIQHEAVHQIDGWDDLRRRLQPDRRCFAFFHPQLPAEPLIFVEIALTKEMPEAIAPLIDKNAEPLAARHFKVATFYSISNCQPGLRGVSLGNFLIKRVAQQLQRELPSVKTFCTLSPIPRFTAWLARPPAPVPADATLSKAALRRSQAEAEARAALGPDPAAWVAQLGNWSPEQATPAQRDALLTLAALCLAHGSAQAGSDPVANFHLSNGARLHRLNWAADLSRKGIKQSAAMMVNYLYELDRVEENHERFSHGEVAVSRAVTQLL